MAKKSIIANAVESIGSPVAIAPRLELTSAIVGTLRADGAAAYEGESALLAFAHVFRALMTTATQAGDYPRFTESARQWRIGYEAAKRGTVASDDTAVSDRSQDAFERRIRAAMSEEALGDNRLLGAKPKAANVDSERMAEKRATIAAQVAVLTEGKSVVELARSATQAKSAVDSAVVVTAKLIDQLKSAPADKINDLTEKVTLAKAKVDELSRAQALAASARDASVKAAEFEARKKANERTSGFRVELRELMSRANDAQLIAGIKAMRAAGVILLAEAAVAKI